MRYDTTTALGRHRLRRHVQSPAYAGAKGDFLASSAGVAFLAGEATPAASTTQRKPAHELLDGRNSKRQRPGRQVSCPANDTASSSFRARHPHLVTALIDDGHAGKGYLLTGPQALTAREQVATIAEVTGRPVDFQDVTRTNSPGCHSARNPARAGTPLRTPERSLPRSPLREHHR